MSVRLRFLFALALISISSAARAQAGASSNTPPQGQFSIGQADPSSPTGETYWQLSPLLPGADPVVIVGSDSNPLFAFCNYTEYVIAVGVYPPTPHTPFVVYVQANSCLTFAPTWLSGTSILLDSLPAAILQ